MRDDKPRLEIGRIWDGHVVEAMLGEGANAVVYLVENTRRKTHFALKVFRRLDSRQKARVEQEAVLREGLRHPNLVRSHSMIEVDGAPALLMDYVEGPTLEKWLADDTRADLEERLEIFRGVVEGCRFAHGWGLVHRDIKPSNILLHPNHGKWSPRISDFGLAKAMEPEMGRYGGLTTVNTGLGAAGYAAPEQVRDAAGVDHRADLYSLGCILYELVCGIGPFSGLSAFDTLRAQGESRYRRPEDIAPGLPPALYDLIRQLMSVKREDRPADCEEVLRRMTAIAAALDVSPAAIEPYFSLWREMMVAVTLCGPGVVALGLGLVFAFLLPA